MKLQKLWRLSFCIFFALTPTVLSYVTIVDSGDLWLSNIESPGGTGTGEKDEVVLVECNQDVQISFATSGNLKREERGLDGSGLGRFDELETVVTRLKIWGDTSFLWDGTMEELNGLTTDTIVPSEEDEEEEDEKIWMELEVEATSDESNCLINNSWDESDDAGLYAVEVTITVVAVGDPPRPDLEFIPDNAEDDDETPCIQIYNSGEAKKDDAVNVRVDITVIDGEEYVDDIVYNHDVGDIENETGESFCFEIITNDDWDNDPDAEIRVRIEITREDNWPEHNEGETANYILIH